MASVRTALFSRSQSGGMISIEDQSLTTGNRFFVDSGSSTGGDTSGFGDSPDKPFLTVDFAIGQGTANNGDIIYVMPGHAETLSAAADITIDVDGISILGLGTRSTKPTFTITTGAVAAPILWTADGCVLDNIRIVGGRAGGSNVTISIEGSFNTFSNSELISTATTELGIGAGLGVIVLDDDTAAISEIIFDNIEYMGGAGNDESFLTVADGSNGATYVSIKHCKIFGTFADNTIQADQGTNTNTLWYIEDSRLANVGGDNVVVQQDSSAVFYYSNVYIFGGGSTTTPLVGFNVSYLNSVWSCEPNAYGATTVIGSVTNWGA